MMTFRISDFDDYRGVISLETEDYENEIEVDIDKAWNEDKEEFDDDYVREIVEEAVSARFPGAKVEW